MVPGGKPHSVVQAVDVEGIVTQQLPSSCHACQSPVACSWHRLQCLHVDVSEERLQKEGTLPLLIVRVKVRNGERIEVESRNLCRSQVSENLDNERVSESSACVLRAACPELTKRMSFYE